MNLCRSRGLFNYSIILLLTVLFNRKIAADRCIHDPKRILTDLVKEGENLLNFNFPHNPKISVLEHVKNLIKKNFLIDVEKVWKSLGIKTLELIMKQTATHIKNILQKTKAEKGENPCIEVLELCEGDSRFDPRKSQIETEIIDISDRGDYDLGSGISPLILTTKSLDDVFRNANDNRPLDNKDHNEETKLQEVISELVLESVTLLRCEVKDFENGETISQFYYFTLNESGYPKFIIKPIPVLDSDNDYIYISSELLAYDDTSSSTLYTEEEESEN